ncbi:glycosyl transferase family 2 [Yoonia maricola]|uniref:Glycosyl transferase family 2 n=1 Tax=Yoonia maricola TaxID=420999 RepID=A0A2M8W4E8_9RHOB|nr:glycosyltransferase family 2 protein [Yoonia maricola]PJI85802.1 glycosyl transferase family 2 [Yoonia maricola]
MAPPKTGLWHAYRLRWKRRRFLFRIWRKRNELTVSLDRTTKISSDAILAFATVRNEIVRLPHFLDYYRELGINHFLFVDNGSDDGTAAFLAQQSDVSLWTTTDSYRLSRFGMDWLGWLQWQYGNRHWCLTVDADELLTYPDAENRDLHALTTWLDDQGEASFGALMLDLYPKGSLGSATYQPGDDPTASLNWFDADNYRDQVHPYYHNLWIQGGVRERVFFADEPARAPTLNKTPLVRWSWRYAYVSSTHQILPTRLHDVFDLKGDSKVSGALLHTKFLPIVAAKSAEELTRGQHFQNTALYQDYHRRLTKNPDFWHEGSCRYEGPAQLVELGLMSKGRWV